MRKILCLGAAVAALLLAPLAGARAQSDPDAINYSALSNPYYTYADLKQAKARDFSDTRVAKIVKMEKKSGMRFHDISDALLRGETFVQLAGENGLSPSDLDDVQKEKDEIANYLSAYETTGLNALPAGKSYGK